MFGHNFYFSTIKKYVITFGTLFNDIHIKRSDANDVTTELIRVPLTYSPKDKMLARIFADPNIDRPTAITLPRMSFEITGLSYDGSRKLNTVGDIVVMATDNSYLRHQYNPVPYNFQFKLYVYSKHAEDGAKIIEQILPFFTPNWTPTVHLIPEMNVTMDIPIVLNSVQQEDNYTEKYAERRAIIWTLTFTLQGYFYGPITEKKVIKFANVTFYNATTNNMIDAIGNTAPAARVTVQPTMYANGTATSNIAASVAWSLIEADDDYGYGITITEEFS